MRNHGFLYVGAEGWRLSPAYDLNPVPIDLKPRVLSTAIDLDECTASLDLALHVVPYFELSKQEAIEIVRQVGAVVSTWRNVATGFGASTSDMERMASAFDHADLKQARSISRRKKVR